MGIFFAIVSLSLLAVLQKLGFESGTTAAMMFVAIAPTAFFFVLAFVHWRKRRNEAYEDPTIKTKNKRE